MSQKTRWTAPEEHHGRLPSGHAHMSNKHSHTKGGKHRVCLARVCKCTVCGLLCTLWVRGRKTDGNGNKQSDQLRREGKNGEPRGIKSPRPQDFTASTARQQDIYSLSRGEWRAAPEGSLLVSIHLCQQPLFLQLHCVLLLLTLKHSCVSEATRASRPLFPGI